MEATSEGLDRKQVFKVNHGKCLLLRVKVLSCRCISKGSWGDFIYTPKPYVKLCISTSPEGSKYTEVKTDDVKPSWNECFTFVIDDELKKSLKISLGVKHLTADEVIGVTYFNVADLKPDTNETKTFPFSKNSEVDLEMQILEYDPFQMFKVIQGKCLLLSVKVLSGRCISKSSLRNLFYTPKPYVKLCISKSAEGSKYTEVKTDDVNPSWNDSFTFVLKEDSHNILKIYLGVKHLTADEVIGVHCKFTVAELKRDTNETKTFMFSKNSEVDLEMKLTVDTKPTLRYSLELCMEEKAFLAKRKENVDTALKQLLGERCADSLESTPTIAVIGSGGGFRAMVGLSGVMTALHESGIMDAVTFVSGLSGSSWYISTLYSHPDFPRMGPERIKTELKNNIDSTPLWLLTPMRVYRYLNRIITKRKMGQPVSLTDLFGHMIGETLLKGRLDSRLSDQTKKLHDADVPFPIVTCVHVKKDESARRFQEWVEFSPYEIGMAKYGTFMKTNQFGSKFFLGELVKEYDEPPLHFLQGVWGSAFSILFQRLFQDTNNMDPTEILRHDLATHIEENHADESSDSSDGEEVDEGQGKKDNEHHNEGRKHKKVHRKDVSTRRTKSKSYWADMLKEVFEKKKCDVLSTRAGRAGIVHNFLRGLHIQKTPAYPLAPFSPVTEEPEDETDSPSLNSGDFTDMFEKTSTSASHMYVVDAGLVFNSPYPLVMRPQRGVDIIISFDFSGRQKDNSEPFNELLLAEKWAKKQGIPFPPIDTSAFDREGVKELYIFKHPTDAKCPVVLHFPLVNNEFRKFSKPGVPRQTDEEKEFADFDIFDDPKAPYSTFKFQYSHKTFERLHQLMEFNTLMHVETIKDVIADCMAKKSKSRDVLISFENIEHLNMVSKRNRGRLSAFVSRRSRGISRPLSTVELDLELANVNEADVLETLPDLE